MANINEKRSFVMYDSFLEAMKHLNDAEFRECVMKIRDYALDGIDKESESPYVNIILVIAKPNLEAARRRYEVAVENGKKGAKYGKLGGAPKGNQNARKKQPLDVDVEENVYVKVDENEEVNKNSYDNENAPLGSMSSQSSFSSSESSIIDAITLEDADLDGDLSHSKSRSDMTTSSGKAETPRFPLKRHILCSKDKTPFTAYTVKKKNIDYYKCNQRGCKTNVSAKKMHERYECLLRFFNITENLKPLLREIILTKIQGGNEEALKMETLLKKQKSEYLGKLKKCKVRFGMGEIDEEIYEMTNKDLQEKLDNVERGLAECRKNLSNLDSEVDDILAMCCKLDSLWRDASLETCQKLQNLLFPNGILWDKEKDNYRTIDENEALSVIVRLSEDYKNKKEENSIENSSFVPLCG